MFSHNKKVGTLPNVEFYRKILKTPSRSLRVNLTNEERLIWTLIRRKQLLGLQFYRQKPLLEFIVDFYCPAAKLVLEIDGTHHLNADHYEKDQARDLRLEAIGIFVLRISNQQVNSDIDIVVEKIKHTLLQRIKL